jgi:hypothetical protein
VQFGVAGDERTGAASPAVLLESGGDGCGQTRVGSQTEIIVGAKIDVLPSFEGDARRLRAGARQQFSVQPLGFQGGQFRVDPFQTIKSHANYSAIC